MAPPARGEAKSTASPRWRWAACAGIGGWVLDAFDFFVLVFLLDTLAAHFSVPKRLIVLTITFTLAARPVGALLFGTLADRFGRRRPLMFCVAYFSLTSLASVFAPSYFWFATLRMLYGIGMGGYWGIGASYAMEVAPVARRGLLSGILQGGYPLGYLLAALAMLSVAPHWGWRAPFVVSQCFALVVILLTLRAPESDAWRQHAPRSVMEILRQTAAHWRIFVYFVALATALICLSHGTQDLYPDFLRSLPGIATARLLGMNALYGLPVLYNIGAILGSLVFGALSERVGRRWAVLLALGVCLVSIPWWAFGVTLVGLAAGSFAMQIGVQGAWGVVPAHLTELSPDAVRSLFPGIVYQLGVLFAAWCDTVEFRLRDWLGYPWALTAFEISVIVVLAALLLAGPEARGKSFVDA